MNRAERRAERFARPTINRRPGQQWAMKLQLRQEQIERARLQAQITERASADYDSNIMTTRIQLLSIDDGDDATELLGKLAVVIGTPMQYAYLTRNDQGVAPWAALLRGALKTIMQMCTDGYTWQDGYALALERAVEVAASADVGELDIPQWEQAWLDACYLCALIERHNVTGKEVI